MVVSRIALPSPSEEPAAGRLSDEVELYQRTYNTLLRSSGETALRVLESSHRAMGSSLHPLAGSDEPDLGAFIYAIRRLPDAIAGAELVIMGQEAEVFQRNGIEIHSWEESDAPARRRRWHDSGSGTHAVLLASASDVDDLIPTLVAFQIEWNKLRVRMRAAGWPREPSSPSPEQFAQVLGGSADDWSRLREAWGDRFDDRMRLIAERRMNLRVRMLGGTQVGYARMTRHWWRPVHDQPRRARPRRPADVPGQLEHAQPRQHRHRGGAGARVVAGRLRRHAAGGRHPARGAGGVPRRAARRARGRTSSTSSRASTSTRTGRRAAPPAGARAGERRRAPAEPDRPARAGPDHPVGEAAARSGSTRGSATWTRRRSAPATR